MQRRFQGARRFVLVMFPGVLSVIAMPTASPSITRADDKAPWAVLTEGAALAAWRTPTGDWGVFGKVVQDPGNEKLLAATSGRGVLVNGPTGRTKNLISRMEHGDVELHLEFMVPKSSNSGVFFQGRYEIQVFDSWGVKNPKYSDCGGVYQRWAGGKGFEGHAPRVNASRAPGEWQSLEVVFVAPRFDAQGKKTANARFVKVVHNGKLIHENVEVTGPTRAAAFSDEKPLGALMFQGDHGPVAYRNVRIRDLPSQ